MRGVEQLALAFHRAADRAGVPYAFMGGMAVMAWGQPRATEDVDTLAVLEPIVVRSFAAALAAENLEVEPKDLLAAFDDESHVTVFAPDSDFHIDLKLARTSHEREEVRRATAIELDGGVIRVVGPEETIAFKLKFGTPQDLADARSVLVRQGAGLDDALLNSLAVRLGVADALGRLRKAVAGASGTGRP